MFKLRNVWIYLLLCLSWPLQASPLPEVRQEVRQEVRVGTLHGGTVHWELRAMQLAGLDRVNGFQLQIQPYANMSATRLALTSGGVDAIVSDWLWAGQRLTQGQLLWFLPYSTSIGRVLVANGSDLDGNDWIKNLRGKRIGVAGGPYSKGWILIQHQARAAGIDLSREAEIKFAAPPLLSAELKRGQLDLLVTFWHYGARLEAEGYRRLVDLNQLTAAQGLDTRMPMLGYLFDRNWVDGHADAAAGFARAVAQTKQRLQSDEQLWQQIRPLIKASDDTEFQALRAGYLLGVPVALDASQIASAQRFYQLIDQSRKQPRGDQLDAALFRLSATPENEPESVLSQQP